MIKIQKDDFLNFFIVLQLAIWISILSFSFYVCFEFFFFCERRECCSLIGLYVSLSSRNAFLSFFSFWYVNYAPVPGDKFCVSEEKSVVKYPSNVVNVWFVILKQSFSPEKDLNYLYFIWEKKSVRGISLPIYFIFFCENLSIIIIFYSFCFIY